MWIVHCTMYSTLSGYNHHFCQNFRLICQVLDNQIQRNEPEKALTTIRLRQRQSRRRLSEWGIKTPVKKFDFQAYFYKMAFFHVRYLHVSSNDELLDLCQNLSPVCPHVVNRLTLDDDSDHLDDPLADIVGHTSRSCAQAKGLATNDIFSTKALLNYVAASC